MIEIPVTLTTYGSIKINDDRVLDLTRGNDCYGIPFDDKDHLLQDLAINLIGAGCDLLHMDGFSDLDTNSVEIQVDDIEAEVHHDLIKIRNND